MKPLTKIKLRLIWAEVRRWFYLTFLPSRMEMQRLQIMADIVKKDDTLWKGIPPHKKSISDIVNMTEDSLSVYLKTEVRKKDGIIAYSVEPKTNQDENNVDSQGDSRDSK